MRRLLLSFFHLIVGYTAIAQVNLPPTISDKRARINPQQNTTLSEKVPTNDKCGFTYELSQARAKGFNADLFEKQIRDIVRQRFAQRTAFTIYTIPVIFHIVHRGEAVGTGANISAALVNEQIAQLNRDFSNGSGSGYGVAADVGIRFCAAVVDPAGRPLSEAGIQRLNAVDSGWSDLSAMTNAGVQNYYNQTIKPGSIWDPYSFINIWAGSLNNDLLGFATFPGLSGLGGLDNSETDATAGVVVASSSVGGINLPGSDMTYNLGRTLTHEVGHFFGLRHIWGDATCGNDYCGDTPQQSDDTRGCPSTTQQSGCIAGQTRMFENYMDYTDDGCMNTFTADQTARVQAVMSNSPRRQELALSKACQTRPGNAVQFTRLKVQQTETGTTGTCPLTKSISVSVAVSLQSTGSATLNFISTGTAANNADFTISPSSVSFIAGDASPKMVTLTIIDDKAVEGSETINLSYNITGTGVVAGPDKQSFTILLEDDDIERRIGNTAVNLLSENFDASTAIPTGWIVDNGGLTNGWTISANGGAGTTVNSAHITQDAVAKPNTYDKTIAGDAYLATPLLDATGLTNINVAFKWRCLGEPGFDEGRIGYILNSDPNTVRLFTARFYNRPGIATVSSFNLPTSLNNAKFRFVFYWFNDDADGTDPGFTVDDVSITAQPVSVESAAGETSTAPQYAGQTVQYLSADNQIIARVAGMSENVGCLTATIQNAGTGRTAIQTPTGSYFRTNKVIRLTPVAVNTSATYQATFYFTPAELSGWAVSELPNLKIMKVKDGVSLSGTITNTDAQITAASFIDNSSTGGYYQYTGSFTDGFSQFMLVSPNLTLPVNLITFEAQATKRSIELSWKTAQERNNKGFVIERSVNGTDFTTIGWVSGVGTTNEPSSYRYTDNFVQPNTVYYYRLRQTDFDGRTVLSSVRNAKINESGLVVTVSPNPVKGQMSVFVSGSTQPAGLQLVNAKGQTVARWAKANLSAPYTVDVSKYAKGYYTLIISLPDADLTKTIILE